VAFLSVAFTGTATEIVSALLYGTPIPMATLYETTFRLATEPDPLVVVTGNMALFNSNQLELEARQRGRRIDVAVPDTSGPRSVQDEVLAPTTRGSARSVVLLVVDHDHERFYLDVDSRGFATRAEAAGWTTGARVQLPNGDRVRLILPPESAGPG
jgi:hypothetical protein